MTAPPHTASTGRYADDGSQAAALGRLLSGVVARDHARAVAYFQALPTFDPGDGRAPLPYVAVLRADLQASLDQIDRLLKDPLGDGAVDRSTAVTLARYHPDAVDALVAQWTARPDLPVGLDAAAAVAALEFLAEHVDEVFPNQVEARVAAGARDCIGGVGVNCGCAATLSALVESRTARR